MIDQVEPDNVRSENTLVNWLFTSGRVRRNEKLFRGSADRCTERQYLSVLHFTPALSHGEVQPRHARKISERETPEGRRPSTHQAAKPLPLLL